MVVAFSSSKSAVLINAETGLWTTDGICDSVTPVLQLFSYWKHPTISLPTEYEVSLHAVQTSVGPLPGAQGHLTAAL